MKILNKKIWNGYRTRDSVESFRTWQSRFFKFTCIKHNNKLATKLGCFSALRPLMSNSTLQTSRTYKYGCARIVKFGDANQSYFLSRRTWQEESQGYETWSASKSLTQGNPGIYAFVVHPISYYILTSDRNDETVFQNVINNGFLVGFSRRSIEDIKRGSQQRLIRKSIREKLPVNNRDAYCGWFPQKYTCGQVSKINGSLSVKG